MRADLAEDTPLLRRVAETLAVAAASQPLLADTVAAPELFMGDVPITVAEDIMALVLDSASAFIRLTGTQLPSVIPPDSMMDMESGTTILAAPCRTDTKFDG